MTRRPEPIDQTLVDAALQRYGHDLTALAHEGMSTPLKTRDPEVARVFEILTRSYNLSYNKRYNPIIIAEPGRERTALVEEIVRRVALGQVPEAVKARRIIALDLELITADLTDHGELDTCFKALFAAIHQSAGRAILFVDDFPRLMGASTSGKAFNIVYLLMPALAKREIQLLGTASLEVYRRYVEKDAAIQLRMCEVLVRDLASQVVR